MNNANQLFFRDIVDFLTENHILSENNKSKLDTIAKTYYSYIINLDNLLDHDIKIDESLLNDNPLVNLTNHHELCIKNLIQLFGENSAIFESKKKYSSLYFNELIKEKLLNFDSIITKDQFESIAINKHIPVYFIVDGIELLNPNYPSNEIKNMLAHIFKAIQMYDDVTDIGDDLKSNQSTYVISKTIQLLKSDNDYYPSNQSYTHKAFFALEELCNPQFDYIVEEFIAAKSIAKKHNLQKIVQWTNIIIEQIKDWKLQIEEIRNA